MLRLASLVGEARLHVHPDAPGGRRRGERFLPQNGFDTSSGIPRPTGRRDPSRPAAPRRASGRNRHNWRRVHRLLASALAACALAVASPAASAASAERRSTEPPKLIVLAVDGGGQALIAGLLDEGKLPAFARLRREGAFADGMVTAFPSKTAASFAAIWTGLPGSETGITGNSVLATPPGEHSLLDVRDGFSAETLRADPLWVRAARAGRTAVALHTTHTWPFSAALDPLDARVRERLYVLTGYTDARLPAEVLDPERTPLLDPEATERLAAGFAFAPGTPPGAFRFDVGDARFVGVFFDDPTQARPGWDSFAVLSDTEDDPRSAGPPLLLARVGVGARGVPGASFSGPVVAEDGGRRVEFRVRAFAAEPGSAGGRASAEFTVYRSGASGVAAHPDAFWRDRLGAPVWLGAAGVAEYASGRLGAPVTGPGTPPDGEAGDAPGPGLAGARLLEIVDAVADSGARHLDAAVAVPDWSLIALYLPVADEMGHLLHGYLDDRLRSHDPARAARARPLLAGAFRSVDRVLGRVLELAEAHGAHVMVVADHGMSGTDHLTHVNVALERAGLLAFGDDGRPDLARTRAMLLTTGDGSVAINRAARPGGIVPPGEEETVLAAVRDALAGIRTASGEPVVAGFFAPSDVGVVRAGGDSTGDLFLRLRPGFLSSPRPAPEILMPVRPAGNHGFHPARRDMQAVLAVWGPRVPAQSWPRATALDVAPTALDLLELPPDPALPGRSLLAPRPLVAPTAPRPAERTRAAPDRKSPP